MLPDYEIVLGKGIGNILFGMTREEIEEILGDADEIVLSEDNDFSPCESYAYNSIRCMFSFDSEHEYRLIKISVENDFFHIGHKIRVGLRKEKLIKVCEELNFGENIVKQIDTEELLPQELISYNQVGLHFLLDDGIISAIQILP